MSDAMLFQGLLSGLFGKKIKGISRFSWGFIAVTCSLKFNIPLDVFATEDNGERSWTTVSSGDTLLEGINVVLI